MSSFRTLQDIVSHQASQKPEAVAIVDRGVHTSYRELNADSNRVAHALRESGCRPGDRIALLLPKSTRAITAMLGVLKCGGIYVPLDTHSPSARLGKIIGKCRPFCVLSDTNEVGRYHELSRSSGLREVRMGWLDKDGLKSDSRVLFDRSDVESASGEPLNIPVSQESTAHILFTSGSTGTPKGVMITHANVLHFINWALSYFGTTDQDRISCHPPLHFDLSTFDIYGTFAAGAQLHLVPPEASFLPQSLAKFIRDSQLTQWFSVPSAMKYMAQFDVIRDNDFPALKRVLWCGEALPVPTLRYWMQRLPHASFTNLYGPTEATIASSYYTVPGGPLPETPSIPIGSPCEGEELLVLNDSLSRVPPGEIGDLYIKGVGLSPGYWEDRDKTESAFKQHLGERIYKTGDLAEIRQDGLIYLLGRSDSQIKRAGYRIELGEIQAALQNLDEIAECAVVVVPSNSFDGTAICCAYVLKPNLRVETSDLRKRLELTLPAYMMPTHWLMMNALPLNQNGKVDGVRLKELFGEKAIAA